MMMKNKNIIQKFKEFNEKSNISDVIKHKKSKEPFIEYKKKNDKFYKRNPSGGDWIEISENEYLSYKKYDKTGRFTDWFLMFSNILIYEPLRFTIQKHKVNMKRLTSKLIQYKHWVILYVRSVLPEHKCKYCGCMTRQPDNECYAKPK